MRRIKALLAGALLLAASAAYAQIALPPGFFKAGSGGGSTTLAFVAGSNDTATTVTATSLTHSYTSPSASNPLLIVGFMGDVSNGADDCGSVTYNGVSMTLAGKTPAGGATTRYVYQYYLKGYTTGTFNIVITCSSSHVIGAVVISEYSGANQTAPLDGTCTTAVSTTAASVQNVSITVGTANDWVIGNAQMNGGGTTWAGGGSPASTLREQSSDGPSFGALLDQGPLSTGADTFSMQVLSGAPAAWGWAVCAYKHA